MRNLTEEELKGLNSITENDTLYLVRRDGDEHEKIFRLRYPSHEQRMIAEAKRQAYYWELRRTNPELKTREDVEKEFAEELEALRSELSKLRREHKAASTEFIELLRENELPDQEVDAGGFRKRVSELGSEVDELEIKIAEHGARVGGILSNSIDYLARQRYVAVLAGLGWEKPVEGKDDKWIHVWSSFDEFRNDHSPLATALELEANTMLSPSKAFFDHLPSQTSGGSDSSTPELE